ncbi:MAG: hypothetical protein J7518_01105 [Nocardioidaceae bacterium]|nr:hypothetical protein [Nocardioidaceae bacterium]
MPAPSWYRDVPEPARSMLTVGAVFGILGGIAGLVVGLNVYAPTAWFAVFELGVPAALLGAIIGLVAGLIARYRLRAR